MKKILIIATVFSFFISHFSISHAQTPADGTHLSAYARLFGQELDAMEGKVSKCDTAFISRYSLVRHGRTYYVPAIITQRQPLTKRECRRYGVKIQSTSGERMATALLSVRKYRRLVASNCLESIEITPPVTPRRPRIR